MNQNMNNEKTPKTKNTRALKHGSLQTVTALVMLAVVVVLNLVAAKLPANLTKLDTSPAELYTLSATTESIAKKLNTDVTLYLVAENGSEDEKTLNLLDRYAALSSHISYQKIDPAARPSFTAEYTTETLASNSIIAVSGNERSTVIPYSKIYTYDVNSMTEQEQQYYQYYGEEAVSPNVFSGESAITSALDYLTADNLPVVYCLQGHGEYALSDINQTVADDLTGENIELKNLTLSTEDAVPTDAAAVFINIPASDIMDDELSKLETYMENGGDVILITGVSQVTKGAEPSAMKNLLKLAAANGMQTQDGLVYESDTSKYYSYVGPTGLLPTIGTVSEIVTNMSVSNVQVLAPYAHGITATDSAPENVSINALLSTSSDAYIKSGDAESAEKADTDPSGTFYIGADAVNSKTGSHMVWYTTPYIEQSISGTGNEAMFLSTFLTLCEKQSGSISLEGKSIAVTSLTVSEQQQGIWGNLFMLIIPLAILLIGLVYWLLRRKA